MNPLQEHPHLFANGKFEVRYEEDIPPILKAGTIYPFGAVALKFIEDGENVTLIARPISDMIVEEEAKWGNTDVEFLKLNEDVGAIKEIIEEQVNGKIMKSKVSAELMLYLLSIGVYPFNQSHFDDGIVIDSTKL